MSKKAKFKKGDRVLVELAVDNKNQEATHMFGIVMKVVRTIPPGIKLEEPMYSVNTVDGDNSLQCEKYLKLFKEEENAESKKK